MHSLYQDCRLCPRLCGVDRTAGRTGFCGQSDGIRLAWAGLHFGEEPPLTGRGGSGALFFSGCTLGCPYCQNEQLSRHGMGREISVAELAGQMLDLQAAGAENVNLVTATQFVPGVVEADGQARKGGLTIPLLWNSSGYERLETLELLESTIDVYLPDCKTLDEAVSRRILGVPDYPQVARAALERMAALRPLVLEGDGEQRRLRRGVVVRHLVLPGLLESTRKVLRWFATTLNGQALLSVMFQYTPNARGMEAPGSRDSGMAASSGEGGRVSRRRLLPTEMQRVLGWLQELDIDEGFVQEAADEDLWLPDFRRINPFPEGEAVPLWHWSEGRLRQNASPGR
jgi:putative pyruvate formate lyase activating enzyme